MLEVPAITELYRYEDRYGIIHLCKYPVVKTTKCGWRISLGFNKTKFVLADTTKKFAAPTREQARQSFIARKAHQIGHLSAALAIAQDAHKFAQKLSADKLAGFNMNTHYEDF